MCLCACVLVRLCACVPVQLSCTVTFDPETEGPHLAHALDYFQYHLKSVSFLPRMDYGAFPQVRSIENTFLFVLL